jgi:uncharacterized protein YdhG (YjbR/CyaY superfamily)
VSEYIASKPKDVQAVLKILRGTIRKAVPAVEEGISYQIPVYKLNERPLLFFAGWKEHFSLYPAGDRQLAGEFKEELAGYEIRRGTIRFPLSDIDCGVLARGFLRLRCRSCGHDRLLPFSCKGRIWCPSCGGRRMADIAAHLVERVFPIVPVRQWVLSLPFALRYRMAYDARLTGAVLNVFIRALFGELRRRAQEQLGVSSSQCGAVIFVQRHGDALNCHERMRMQARQGAAIK